MWYYLKKKTYPWMIHTYIYIYIRIRIDDIQMVSAIRRIFIILSSYHLMWLLWTFYFILEGPVYVPNDPNCAADSFCSLKILNQKGSLSVSWFLGESGGCSNIDITNTYKSRVPVVPQELQLSTIRRLRTTGTLTRKRMEALKNGVLHSLETSKNAVLRSLWWKDAF